MYSFPHLVCLACFCSCFAITFYLRRTPPTSQFDPVVGAFSKIPFTLWFRPWVRCCGKPRCQSKRVSFTVSHEAPEFNICLIANINFAILRQMICCLTWKLIIARRLYVTKCLSVSEEISIHGPWFCSRIIARIHGSVSLQNYKIPTALEGFSSASVLKNLVADAGDSGSIPR